GGPRRRPTRRPAMIWAPLARCGILPGRFTTHAQAERSASSASSSWTRSASEVRTPGNAAVEESRPMKAGIHPVYETRTFHCYGCGTEWQTRTTMQGSASDGKVHLDVCSNCHPFFTGKQKLVDKAGRVERFRKKYGTKTDKAEAAAQQ